MKEFIKFIGMFVIFCLLQGCTTLADSVAAKGTGSFRIYNNTYDEVWDATLDVVANSSLVLVSKDKSSGQILAQQSMSAVSYGENVAIFVESQGYEGKTRIEIVSKRAIQTNLFARDWEEYILYRLDKRLNQ